MVEESERDDVERRIKAGFVTRLYDLSVAGGASASGLANRVAEAEKSLVINWNSGNPVIEWGGHRSHFSQDGLNALARDVFEGSPSFAEEAAVWLDRRSKQIGFNNKTVTGLFPEPAASTLTREEQQARAVAAKRNMVAGSF